MENNSKYRTHAKVLIYMIALSIILITGCTSTEDIRLEEGELDISGTYYGYEIYTTPNSNTNNFPDTVTFPWQWRLTRTSAGTYSVYCYHPATEETGSIKASPEYELSVDNIKLINNHYIGLANYIQLYFEEIDGTMMAQGHFNMIKSSGETDVRVIVLTRTSTDYQD